MITLPARRVIEPGITLTLPPLRMMTFCPSPMVPAVPIAPSVTIVILRGKLSLIAGRKVLRILPVLQIWATWIVLISAAFYAIAAAVRLVDPYTAPGVGKRMAPQPQSQQQNRHRHLHYAPPPTVPPERVTALIKQTTANGRLAVNRTGGAFPYVSSAWAPESHHTPALYGCCCFPIIAAF
jgi:hypothetical protein